MGARAKVCHGVENVTIPSYPSHPVGRRAEQGRPAGRRDGLLLESFTVRLESEDSKRVIYDLDLLSWDNKFGLFDESNEEAPEHVVPISRMAKDMRALLI